MTSAITHRRMLNAVLAIGVIDGLLLGVLLYVAFIDRHDAAVSAVGMAHGLGYLLLLGLAVCGVVRARCWGWWFPLAVLVTGGPVGTIVGDIYLRRRLNRLRG